MNWPPNRRLALPGWCLAIALCVLVAACAPPGSSTQPPTTGTEAGAAPLETGAPAASSVETAPPARSFLGFLANPGPAPPALVPGTQTAMTGSEDEAETPQPGPSMTDAEIAAVRAAGGTAPAPSRQPRLFGFLVKRVPGEATAAETPVANAATTPEPAADPVARRGSLFAPREADKPPDPALAALTPAGSPVAGLPFGQIARVCGVAPRKLGIEVARSEGAGTYRLIDSDPSSIAMRPQFITGFKDNCARQFNAALALFGTSAVHEATRYNPLNTNPYSETDAAYETVKLRLCGARSGKPCPERKANRLARKTAFVSVYRGFGDSGDWLEMFLHNGEVVAYAARSN